MSLKLLCFLCKSNQHAGEKGLNIQKSVKIKGHISRGKNCPSNPTAFSGHLRPDIPAGGVWLNLEEYRTFKYNMKRLKQG